MIIAKRRKRAAMELTMGTMVTIVLLVAVLIGGIVLTQRILSGAKGAIDLTDQQLKNEINKLFSEEKRVVIYPSTRIVEMKQEETDAVGVGIQNLLRGAAATDATFSYEVTVQEAETCTESQEQVLQWIKTGKRADQIIIPVGELAAERIVFEVPAGTSLCTARFRVNVFADGAGYATDSFDVVVKA